MSVTQPLALYYTVWLRSDPAPPEADLKLAALALDAGPLYIPTYHIISLYPKPT